MVKTIMKSAVVIVVLIYLGSFFTLAKPVYAGFTERLMKDIADTHNKKERQKAVQKEREEQARKAKQIGSCVYEKDGRPCCQDNLRAYDCKAIHGSDARFTPNTKCRDPYKCD